MSSASRSWSPIEAFTLGAARACVGVLLAVSLASCFDSRRIIFEIGGAAGEQDAAAATPDIAVSELAPAPDAAGVATEPPSGEAATGLNEPPPAEAAAAGSVIADTDAGSAVSSDAAP